MFYPDFHYGLGRERLAEIRQEVEHNRLEASLTREARLAKATSLSEEARLAKAHLSEGTVLRKKGRLARGTAFVTGMLR